MARNIPSLYSLTGNRLYDLGVRSTNLEQYNYPAQLVERYEDITRERAAIDIQKKSRARGAKVKIVNILRKIEGCRRYIDLQDYREGQELVENYTLTTEQGNIITDELGKLDVQDFLNQSFWWKLVSHGIQQLGPQPLPPMPPPPTWAVGMLNKTDNNRKLLNIILLFVNNLERMMELGIINPYTAQRDAGALYISRNRNNFLAAIAGQRIIFVGQAYVLARQMWENGIGRIGLILSGPLQADQLLFGRRR
tara:strand:+ start:169 stop:921 length:753 start_codon:yes stop_codon:yes gene_type:complete